MSTASVAICCDAMALTDRKEHPEDHRKQGQVKRTGFNAKNRSPSKAENRMTEKTQSAGFRFLTLDFAA
jgi:hypothetical protein